MSDTSTRWSANVICDGAAQLWYFIDGRPVTERAPHTLDIVGPEEHLLLAAAGAYAATCRTVLALHRRARHAFEVIATASRASRSPDGAYLPSQVALTCLFASGIAPEEAERVAAEARESQTQVSAAGVTYQVHVLRPSLRGFGPHCAAARLSESVQLSARAAWPAH